MRTQSHLWNDLDFETRERLMPYMIEAQILHIEQCKIKAVRAHKRLMKDYNDQITNCKDSLKKAIRATSSK
jgi:hypothetical protein